MSDNGEAKLNELEAYCQELERRLAESESNLKALVSDQIDAVISAGGTTPLLLFQAQQALHESRNELERRVTERTAQLQRVNERLETELAQRKKLQDSLAFQAMLLENVHDAIFSVDQNFNLTSWNRAAEQLYGWKAEEVIGRSIEDIIPDGTRRARYQTLNEQGKGFVQAELAQRSRQGRQLVVEVSTIAMKDYRGQVTGYVTAHRDITEKKQIELELQSSEERFRQMIQLSPDPIYVHVDRKFVFVNPAMLGLFGARQPEQLLGKDILDFIHPEDQPIVLERIGGIYEMGQTAPMLAEKFLRLDGSLVTAEASAAPIIFDGKPGALVIVRDITERIKAEEALRESEIRFRVMADGTPVMIWVTDTDGGLQFINRAYSEFFGVTLEDMNPDDWQSLIHSDDRKAYADEFRSALKACRLFRTQARVRYHDGQWRWIDSHAMPRFSESGEFLGMVGSSMDITEQKRIEVELRESEELFRVALANSPIVVFTCDRDLRYTWVYNLHPASPTLDLIGKRDDELLDIETARNLMEIKRSVIESGKSTRQEFCIPLGGVNYLFDATLEPLWGDQSNITGLAVAALDITELRKLEELEIENRTQAEVQRLLVRHRELERLQISRDLHDGPLQSMIAVNIGLSQALQAGYEEEWVKKVTDAQGIILGEIRRLREICNDLRPPALAPLGLAKAIQSHLNSFQERFPEIKIQSELKRDQQIIPSEVRAALFRVYQELLLNACQHSHADEIWVRLDFNQTEVVLEIVDNGIGFTKPKNWLELGRSGHLGLIGVRERVDLINGQFEIESEPEAGTLMRVTVPLS